MNKALLVGLLAGAIGLTGCVDLSCLTRCSGHSQHSSSLVDFLYPDGRLPARVVQVVSSNPQAFGLVRAEQAGVPAAVVERKACPSRQEFSRRVFEHEAVFDFLSQPLCREQEAIWRRLAALDIFAGHQHGRGLQARSFKTA